MSHCRMHDHANVLEVGQMTKNLTSSNVTTNKSLEIPFQSKINVSKKDGRVSYPMFRLESEAFVPAVRLWPRDRVPKPNIFFNDIK